MLTLGLQLGRSDSLTSHPTNSPPRGAPGGGFPLPVSDREPDSCPGDTELSCGLVHSPSALRCGSQVCPLSDQPRPGSVKMMPLAIFGSSPWLPHRLSRRSRPVSQSVSHGPLPCPRPHPALSSLPFFPSHQTVWGTATRGTSVGGALHHGKFYWTHSPRPKLGTVGFLGQLRNGPAPQKAQPPICQTLIKALPGRGMLRNQDLYTSCLQRAWAARVLTRSLIPSTHTPSEPSHFRPWAAKNRHASLTQPAVRGKADMGLEGLLIPEKNEPGRGTFTEQPRGNWPGVVWVSNSPVTNSLTCLAAIPQCCLVSPKLTTFTSFRNSLIPQWSTY